MTRKKPSTATKKDKKWQEEVAKKMKAEKVTLDHPQGKERFTKVLKQIFKKTR